MKKKTTLATYWLEVTLRVNCKISFIGGKGIQNFSGKQFLSGEFSIAHDYSFVLTMLLIG
jgi:hypothetical protein